MVSITLLDWRDRRDEVSAGALQPCAHRTGSIEITVTRSIAMPSRLAASLPVLVMMSAASSYAASASATCWGPVRDAEDHRLRLVAITRESVIETCFSSPA